MLVVEERDHITGNIRGHSINKSTHARLTGLIIGKSQCKHDGQPEERANDDEPGTSLAVASVHEEEKHEGGLGGGAGQGNDNVERAKIPESRPGREARAENEREDDGDVALRVTDVFGMFRRALFAPLSMTL